MNNLIEQIEGHCFDGVFQLACDCYGAATICALDILALLRDNEFLGTEITADLQHLADEVLVLKSRGGDNRARKAASQFNLIRKNLGVIRRSRVETGQLPRDWRAKRVQSPVYERITLVDQYGKERIVYDRKKKPPR